MVDTSKQYSKKLWWTLTTNTVTKQWWTLPNNTAKNNGGHLQTIQKNNGGHLQTIQ